jgi:hypothetical protein
MQNAREDLQGVVARMLEDLDQRAQSMQGLVALQRNVSRSSPRRLTLQLLSLLRCQPIQVALPQGNASAGRKFEKLQGLESVELGIREYQFALARQQEQITRDQTLAFGNR